MEPSGSTWIYALLHLEHNPFETETMGLCFYLGEEFRKGHSFLSYKKCTSTTNRIRY